MTEFDMEIDKELLINLIKERPQFWDKSLANYTKTKNLTVEGWREVCAGLFQGFESFSDSVQKGLSLEVYKKWTNLKDSWYKCEKKMSDKSFNKKKGRKYIYYKELSFLSKNLPLISRQPIKNENVTMEYYSEFMEGEPSISDTISEEASEHINNSVREVEIPKPTEIVCVSSKMNIEEANLSSSAVDALEDTQLTFFKGLLPMLQDLDEDERLEFQIGVLNVIKNIRRARKEN